MADVHDKETRSRNMAAIKGQNTKPELTIRHELHKAGCRYRLHVKDLPGKPDMVFPKFKAILFVHGCFWHQHNCHLFKWPKTRQEFWQKKISGNIANDQKVLTELQALRWRTAVIWECALKGKTRIPVDEAIQAIITWLKSDRKELILQGKNFDRINSKASATDGVSRSGAFLCQKAGSKR